MADEISYQRLKTICGIYLITNTLNGKIYVGSSVRIGERWMSHRNQLKASTHQNTHLQSAWNKYGESVFQFELLECCLEDDLIARETFWVEHYDSLDSDNGYNLEYPDRRGHTEETKRKISASRIGNPKCIGHKHSEETKRKIGKAHKGNQYNKGRICSVETRKKMSESHKGLLKGKKLSAEHKAKLAEARIGRKLSAEHKAKLSISAKRDWEKRRKRNVV